MGSEGVVPCILNLCTT